MDEALLAALAAGSRLRRRGNRRRPPVDGDAGNPRIADVLAYDFAHA
jgi:hypothetical protein